MNSKLKWRTVFSTYQKALKWIFRLYPQTVLSYFSYAVWTALSPFAGIYLAALVVEELTGQRNPDRLFLLVALTLCTTAIIALVTALLGKWRAQSQAGWWYKTDKMLSDKVLTMDFEQLEKDNVAQLRDEIVQSQNSGGWGLPFVLVSGYRIIGALCMVLGGVGLSVTLFLHPVPQSAGGFVVLNNPLFAVGLAAFMMLMVWLSSKLTAKASSFWAANIGSHNLGNRLFSFYGYLGYRNDMATDVRIYRQEKICEKYNQNKEDTFCSKGIFAKYFAGKGGLLIVASAAFSTLFTGAVYAFVCLKAWAGAFGAGEVTQYVAALARVTTGMFSLLVGLGDMRKNTPFLQQVFDFLEIPNKMEQGNLPVRQQQHEIQFKDVSFRYHDSQEFVLKNVNITFKSGCRLAVVGMNGSGKTTLIKLLCRLYDPTEGTILLDGKDIKEYDYQQYMSIFSVVFQDFKLFALPLAQNVAGSATPDQALAEQCLIKAGFGERLKQLPNGINTFLYKNLDESGVDMSGGEEQKIAIARALYKDAPFIILDEPTAALDAIAEAEIYSKFDEMVGDKTAIYISHRLSSCKFCDEIAVFHQGKLVQFGSHEQLVQDKQGQYFALWTAQAQYYAEKPQED